MKSQTIDKLRRGVSGVLSAALLGTAPLLATGSGSIPPLDEDVGTMPVVVGDFGPYGWTLEAAPNMGSAAFDDGAFTAPALQPAGVALAISGHHDLVRLAVEDLRGHGFIALEKLGGDQVRASFHGDVEVALDRRFLDAGWVQVELLVTAEFAPAFGAAAWKGGSTAVVQLPADAALPVPAAQLSRLSGLGPVHFQALAADGPTYQLGLKYRPGKVILRQHGF